MYILWIIPAGEGFSMGKKKQNAFIYLFILLHAAQSNFHRNKWTLSLNVVYIFP